MKRREFLTRSLIGGYALLLSKSLLASTKYVLDYKNDHKKLLNLIQNSKKSFKYVFMTGIDPTAEFIRNRDGGDTGAVRPGIIFFNDNMESAIVDVPLFPHSIEQNPNNSNRVMLIPRRGKSCIEFDIVKNKVVSEITLKSKKFYGHGCYIPGTDLFYASTFLHGSSDASMVLFNIKENKIIKEIEIPDGAGSHQCSISKDKKHIIITFSESAGNKKPSIAWFDVNTGEVVKRVYGLPEHAEHFHELSDKHLVYTGGAIPTPTSTTRAVFGVIDPKQEILNFTYDKEEAKRFEGQGVGVIGLETRDYVFITNLRQSLVYAFNYKTGKLVKKIEVPQPRGICISNDEKFLFVTRLPGEKMTKAPIVVIDIDKLEVVDKFNVEHALAYSSHITKFKLT